MTAQGTQFEVLETIADIQEAISAEEVEDTQIAEEIYLDIGTVRTALDALAKAGYVKLEKMDTLSGMAYSASLTSQGNTVLREGRGMVSDHSELF